MVLLSCRTHLEESLARFPLLFQLSRNTAAKFACHALFLFGLGVIRALLSLELSLEVDRFAFMAAEFVTSLVNKAGLFQAEVTVTGQENPSCCMVVTQ